MKQSRPLAAFALLAAMSCSSERTDRSRSEDRDERRTEKNEAAPEREAPAPAARWEGLAALLPHPEIRGWRATAEGPRLFPASELHTYMNGQADSYIEYGVRTLAVADYHPANGPTSRTVQIELYD